MSFIEVKNVSFSYDERGKILEDFSLNIEKGSFVAILGHNGSGKSTLAKLFNGLNTPEKGKILVDGIDTSDDDKAIEIRNKVGLVFQNPDNQIVATIVEEDVAFGPENLGLPREEIRKRVDESLELVGMTKYIHHEPHKLSGGQKQRVAIAGILAMQPDCIVFDEATAMLDPRGRKDIMTIIKRLNREFNKTVILITHYMDEASQADRVVVINEGKKLIDGTPEKVFCEVELLKGVGLDVPQPTELIYKLKKAGVAFDDGIIHTEECVKAISEALED